MLSLVELRKEVVQRLFRDRPVRGVRPSCRRPGSARRAGCRCGRRSVRPLPEFASSRRRCVHVAAAARASSRKSRQAAGVHARGERLVEQLQLRVDRQDGGQGRLVGLAARQAAHRTFHQRQEIERSQQFHDPVLDAGGVGPVDPQHHADMAQDAHFGIIIGRIRQEGEAAAEVDPIAAKRLAVVEDFAPVQSGNAGQAAEQRGLARPIRAQKRDDLARSQFE